MTKLEELIQELCPDGVEYKPLGDIATISRGGSFQKKDYTENGVPCIHYGQIYMYYGLFAEKTLTYISEEVAQKQKFADPGDIIMAVTSENIDDVCKCMAWLGSEKAAVSGHTAIIHHSINPKYLVYWLNSSIFYQQKVKIAHGTKVIEVAPARLTDIILPVPPQPVQREIVRILDNFTELTAELAARKKHYEYYTEQLMNFGDNVKVLTLGEIGSVKMCKRILKSQTNTEGGIPFYKIGTFGKEPDAFISEEVFEEYKEKYSYPKKGDILISCSGTIGRTVVFDGEPAYFQDSNIVWLEHDGTLVTNKYLQYCYKKQPWQISTGGTIARLYNDNILKAQIPVPSIEEQERIVGILDRFDALCNDLTSGLPAEIEARTKQYEYYRDKLLTFESAK